MLYNINIISNTKYYSNWIKEIYINTSPNSLHTRWMITVITKIKLSRNNLPGLNREPILNSYLNNNILSI